MARLTGSAKARGRLPDRAPHRPAPRRVRPPGRRLRPLLGLAGGLLLVVLALVFLPGGFGGGDPVRERAAELAAQDRQRDAELTRRLATMAEQARSEVTPVLDGLARAAAGSAGSGAAGEGEVATWRQSVEAAAGPLRARPSGGTEVNLARAGFSGAVTTVGRAVEAYAASLDATGELAGRLRALAGELRRDAVTEWSAAASQLDQAGIASGVGHLHVFLEGTNPHGY